MRKLAIVFLSATLLSSSAFAKKDNVVATYVDGDVTSSQVMEKFGPMLKMDKKNKGKKFSELDKKIQEALVQSYIMQKTLDKEIKRLKIRESNDFQEKLKAFEDQLLQKELMERHLKASITDKMIDEEYSEIKKNLKGQKEIKVSHILVETEEESKKIKKRLDKGEKFEALMKEYSKKSNPKVSADDLGYATKGMYVPEFESKAFAMKKNEISDPVKTQFGWHIIKVSDSRPVKMPSKDQALSEIKGKLSQKIMKKYFEELKAKSKIELKL